MAHTELSQFEMPPGAQTIDRRHNLTLEEFINEYDMCVVALSLSRYLSVFWPSS